VLTIEDGGFRNWPRFGKLLEATESENRRKDGEICVKRTHKNVGITKDWLNKNSRGSIKDEYFHTGDIGEIDADGFLKITGTEERNVQNRLEVNTLPPPVLLENRFKQSRFINNNGRR